MKRFENHVVIVTGAGSGIGKASALRIGAEGGKVFFSIKDDDKTPQLVETARMLVDLAFAIVATRGTAAWLTEQGIACDVVNKVYEGRPDITDLMKDGGVQLVMNSTEGAQAVEDSKSIRNIALYDKIPYFTTAAGSHARDVDQCLLRRIPRVVRQLDTDADGSDAINIDIEGDRGRGTGSGPFGEFTVRGQRTSGPDGEETRS